METGVDKGLGSCVLSAALLRNHAEGHPGRYLGTDINPQAGWLFQGPYRKAGQILYGDSIESLQCLEGPIDLFINDSDHSAEYEEREYACITSKSHRVRNWRAKKNVICGCTMKTKGRSCEN